MGAVASQGADLHCLLELCACKWRLSQSPRPKICGQIISCEHVGLWPLAALVPFHTAVASPSWKHDADASHIDMHSGIQSLDPSILRSWRLHSPLHLLHGIRPINHHRSLPWGDLWCCNVIWPLTWDEHNSMAFMIVWACPCSDAA